MNPATALLVPPRLVLRALDDLHRIALVAEDVNRRVGRLEAMLDESLTLGRDLEAMGGEVLTLFRRLDRRAVALLQLGERMEAHASSVLHLGERIDERGHQIVAEGKALQASAREVTESAAHVLEALPLLERAVAGLEATPDDIYYAYALYNLGATLRRLGRPAEAVPFLQRRLEVSDFKRGVVQAELNAALRESGQAPAEEDDGKGGKPKKDKDD